MMAKESRAVEVAPNTGVILSRMARVVVALLLSCSAYWIAINTDYGAEVGTESHTMLAYLRPTVSVVFLLIFTVLIGVLIAKLQPSLKRVDGVLKGTVALLVAIVLVAIVAAFWTFEGFMSSNQLEAASSGETMSIPFARIVFVLTPSGQ